VLVVIPNKSSMTSSGKSWTSLLMQWITSKQDSMLILNASGTRSLSLNPAPWVPKRIPRWLFLTRPSATVIHRILPKNQSPCAPCVTSQIRLSTASSGAETCSASSFSTHPMTWQAISTSQNSSWHNSSKTPLSRESDPLWKKSRRWSI